MRPMASPASPRAQGMQSPSLVAHRRAGIQCRPERSRPESDAPAAAESGRSRRACPRHCRARNCLRSRHKIRGSAESKSAPERPPRYRRAGRCRRRAGADGSSSIFGRRRLQEIAAELADILEQRAVPAHDVVPELACGKFVGQHHRAARAQHAAGRDDAADAVKDRQAIVQPVFGEAAVSPANQPPQFRMRRWLMLAAFGRPVVPEV